VPYGQYKGHNETINAFFTLLSCELEGGMSIYYTIGLIQLGESQPIIDAATHDIAW
jgi:hypothetical protein